MKRIVCWTILVYLIILGLFLVSKKEDKIDLFNGGEKNSLVQSRVDPVYPSKEIEVNKKTNMIDTFVELEKSGDIQEGPVGVDNSVNIKDYASNKNEFLKYYKSVSVQVWVGVSYYTYCSSSDCARRYEKDFKFDIKISGSNTGYQKILWKDLYWNRDRVYVAFEVHIEEFWNGDNFGIRTGVKSILHNESKKDYTNMQSEISFKKYSLNSAFNFDTFFNKLDSNSNGLGRGSKNGGSASSNKAKGISIVSKDSPVIDSENNRAMIIKEVKKRIVDCFDGNNGIIDWFENVGNGGKNGLEITIPKQENGSAINAPRVVTQFSFNRKDNGQPREEKWSFTTDVDFKLDNEYWTKNIYERLVISPGSVIDSDGINIIKDIEEVDNEGKGKEQKYNEGKIKYHTTVGLSFGEKKDNPNDKDYDHISINGVQLNGYNGQYNYVLEHFVFDFNNQENVENSTSYKVEITHDANPNIQGDVGGKWSCEIIVENSMDSLNLSLMNWGENNPDYEKLTSPTIKDPATGKEKDNPDYDPRINKKTGTKEKLIWVHKQSNENLPFELDPVSDDNYLIDSKDKKDYDLGYIALASEVGGAGFSNYWGNETFSAVNRYKIDTNMETNNESNPYVVEKNVSSVQTFEGLYHFTIESDVKKSTEGKKNPPYYLQKFMYVNKNYGDFIKDINAINKNNIVSDFWSTSHGDHLRDYMIRYKGWNVAGSEDFNKLSYEGVIAYWKNYVSDIRNGLAKTDPVPDNRVNFVDVTTSNLKSGFQTSTSEIYKKRIRDNVKNRMIDGYWRLNPDEPYKDEDKKVENREYPLKKAKVDLDYQILIYDSMGENGEWKDILDLDLSPYISNEENRSITIKLKLKALPTSTLLIGETEEFSSVHSIDIDETKLVDLSDLDISNQIHNFSGFDKIKFYNNYLKDYPINQVEKLANNKGVRLEYGVDYEISTFGNNGVGVSDNDKNMEEFLKNANETPLNSKELKATIFNIVASNKVEGAKDYLIVHNFYEKPAPDYPEHKGDNNGKNGASSESKKNVPFWIWVVIGLICLGGALGGFVFYQRRKKPGQW
ncbi:hypothetical protein SCORR_v1c10390 (plasmid) [Spiroplasma corruscae]|uniref:Uncharacterized protein n=1 Tax=Spiroplasma corruscae TaxID=216934 RepID=A0A222EQY7_9MOLU|nr:hypothetical protein [Spiroplasma corruscae]ASP28811.1 hypothetical protein SCORR_v1c10390 [Spiroplasma corruscae]